MIKINIEQNTKEWEVWRGGVIGASDMPKILGKSAYGNRQKLLMQKKTGEKEEFSDFTLGIFKKGHLFEDMMRPIISEKFKIPFSKSCGVLDTLDYIAASFDGINLEMKVGWECKNSEKEMLYIKKHGEPSENYYAQAQQQILVGGLKYILFTAGVTAENCLTIKVMPDNDCCNEIIDAARLFHEDMNNGKVAPSQLKDLIVKAWAVKKRMSALKKEEKAIMDAVKLFDHGENFAFKDVKYSVSYSTTVSLDKDKLALDVDLSKYEVKKKATKILIKGK